MQSPGGNKAMTTFVIFWAVLGVATLALALYRKFVTMREDDYLHLSAGEERLIPQQVATFRRIGAIDKWGITMTIVTVILGLALAAMYLYQAALRNY
jgi:hypothetical protein